MRSTATLLSTLLLLTVVGCTDDGISDAEGTDSSTTGDGDGDGDSTTNGDGDGDSTTTTNGDGDGDAPGDGDGDAPGDGDGDTPGDGDGDTPGDGDGDAGCVYPDAAEPMALDQPISAYAWPEAIHADGTVTPLALDDAYCDSDEVIDWSPHDILVFVSIPAW